MPHIVSNRNCRFWNRVTASPAGACDALWLPRALRYTGDLMSTAVRVRYAPSPTGDFHVGGARTALFNFPVARIDHCWVSGNIQPVSARVHPTTISDHRPLEVDLIIPNEGN